ncbi:MAG: Adenosyl-chloride synthase [Syntrophus sp. SKADARSKE-3]|nr:Adenosyl-chloride synthase [Syntrophus sp. SKADARSKE-3]
MKPSGIVTLTTDFGTIDPFAGQMKGAILFVHPQAVIIDITHQITAHDILEGSFVLASSFSYFPAGTIHVAVVDPGVGSSRRGIAVQSGGHVFVGPDNGIFSGIFSQLGMERAVHITNQQYTRTMTGVTFHGRDIFAPVAAWLARGIDMTVLGPVVEDLVRLESIKPEIFGNRISGQVVYVDTFGNAITNIGKNLSDDVNKIVSDIRIKKRRVTMASHYEAATGKTLNALFNSSGHLEIFVNKGRAADLYGIRRGDKVSISLSPLQGNPLSGQ